MCRPSWPQASSHLFPFLCPLEPLGVPWAQTPKPGIRMLSSALPQPLPQPFSEARAWPGWDWPASSLGHAVLGPLPSLVLVPSPACLRLVQPSGSTSFRGPLLTTASARSLPLTLG